MVKGKIMENTGIANIMLIGRTGVGKSAFVNYFLGNENMAESSAGLAVTKGTHEYIKYVNGYKIKIYDTEGLEITSDYSFNEISDEIIRFILEKENDKKIENRIHTIFYCINVMDNRYEDKEIEIIKKIEAEIHKDIHIILTHCLEKENVSREEQELIERVEKGMHFKEGEKRIFRVSSVEQNLRKGKVKKFGRDEVISTVFRLLWNNLLKKVSVECAKELVLGTEDIVYSIFEHLEMIIKKNCTSIKIIKEALKEDGFEKLEEEFEKIDEQIEEFEEQTNEKYQEIIKDVVKFYNQYGKALDVDIEDVKAIEITDFLIDVYGDFDIDEIIEKSDLQRKMNEIEEGFDEESVTLMIKCVGKMTNLLFTMKKELIKILRDIKMEILSNMPDEDKIAKEIYEELCNL
jgi:GTP-binding protein EngB required for normal cell division